MGEIADMFLDGTLCEWCGVYIDDDLEPGHPRLCPSCLEEEQATQANKLLQPTGKSGG